jgi:hypothetical protein
MARIWLRARPHTELEADLVREPHRLSSRQNIMPSRHRRYPHTTSPSRASVIGRQRAGQEAARGCPDAWYRVQVLASVAEHAPQGLVLPILEEAAREARSCHDAYGAAAAAIRAMAPGKARAWLERRFGLA